jgi:hypothetical protein
MAGRAMPQRRSVARTQRRKFVWARSLTGELAAIGTVTESNLLADFETRYGANLIGATVARIRGVIAVRPDATPADTTVVVGVRVGSDTDTVLTGPTAQPYEDWMLWEPFILAATGTGVTQTQTAMTRVVDVKSMRKLEEIGEELHIVASQTGTETATELGWALSIGLLLP